MSAGADNPAGRRVVTFGTFDLFHLGHLRIIERARACGDWLAVGVSSDELNIAKKQLVPMCGWDERAAIVGALKAVAHVFKEEALELKRQYLIDLQADVLVMGHDWEGRLDEFRDIVEVIYFPRTPAISTGTLIDKIRAGA